MRRQSTQAGLLAILLALQPGCFQKQSFVYEGPKDATADMVEARAEAAVETSDIPLLFDAPELPDTPVVPDATDHVETVDLPDSTVEIDLCSPSCQGKECGPDGCGGECGLCGASGACKDDGTCLCEFEKCGGTCCFEGEVCGSDTCCAPDCEGKQCGDDGCGGSCGECEELMSCQQGECACTFASCPEGVLCCAENDICCAGECCHPDCESKQCGWDCCEKCGECSAGYNCVEDAGEGTALCEPDCADLCMGKTCGPAGAKGECDCGAQTGGCDDGNQCTDDVCSEDGECSNPNNTAECDDGNPCTEGDLCIEGECAGTLKQVEDLLSLGCLCLEDEDCDPLENGDVCDGTLFCLKNGEDEDGLCAVAPGTVLDCADAVDCTNDSCDPVEGCINGPDNSKCEDNNVCTTNICSDELGCLLQNNELPCDDNEPCTTGEMCSGGFCVGGAPTVCADAHDCTDDSCVDGQGCLFQSVNAKCDDLNVCTSDTCDPQSGCTYQNNNAVACEIADKCYEPGLCTGGSCLPGNKLNCDDSNPCTDDSCDPDVGCLNVPNDNNSCSDNDACNGLEFCSDSVCLAGDPLDCVDAHDCTEDSCNPATGCVNAPTDGACDDGNSCTDDSCSPDAGCQFLPNNAIECSDGDECTLDDYCEAGECIPGEFDAQNCGPAIDWDHDGLVEDDACPLAYDPGNHDDNGFPGPDACEVLADHGQFDYSRPIELRASGGASTWRRTNEPVEIPLVNGLLDENLIIYWRLDGDGADRSSYGHHAQWNGSVPFVDSAWPDLGQAADLSLGNGFLFANLEDQFASADALSVIAWVKPTAVDSDGWVAARWEMNGQTDDAWLLSVEGGFFRLTVDGPNGSSEYVVSKTPVVSGQWYHVAAVFGDGNLLMYVNGVLETHLDSDTVELSSTALPVAIGHSPTGLEPHQFDGMVDEFLLFHRALSPAEVIRHYESRRAYLSHLLPGTQTDYDDVRVTETPGDGDPCLPETVKRNRVIGARPHSDTPCPAAFDGWGVTDIPAIADRDDLCGVAGYWRLDGEVADVKGEHDGETTDPMPAYGRFADVGGALQFGTGHSVSVYPAGDFEFSRVTVEAWVRPTEWDLNVNSHIIAASSTSGGYRIGCNQGHFFVSITPTSGGWASATRQMPNDAAGHWFHVAGVFDGDRLLLYVNGLQVAQQEVEGQLKYYDTQSPFAIGDEGQEEGPPTGMPFTGIIDEVLVHRIAKSPDYIFNRANPDVPTLRFLANTQVTPVGDGATFPARDYTLHWGSQDAVAAMPLGRAIANGKLCFGLLNECLGYVGWWRFNEGSGDVAVDSSTVKLSGTYVGAPEFQGGVEELSYIGGKLRYIEIADTETLHLDNGTIEAAFIPANDLNTEMQVGSPLMDKTSGGFDNGFELYVSKVTGELRFRIDDQVTQSSQLVSSDSTEWAKNQLYRAAATFGASGMHMLVDGVEQQESLEYDGGLGGEDTPLHFSNHNGTDRFFSGTMDGFRIMSRVLAEDEHLHYPPLSFLVGGADLGTACGGLICPVLDGYGTSCNSREFCEYAVPDATGWQEWDVWIYVPPGDFVMGGPKSEGGADDERPQHMVTVSQGYYVLKYEIVTESYEACMADNNSCSMASVTDWGADDWGTNKSSKGRSDHPQNGLTWQQAADFCEWLAPGGRLPTETEWEYAASGPVHRKYPWSDAPEPICSDGRAVYDEGGENPGMGCSTGGTWAADSMSAGASWCGAMHMAGNVWEWVEDFYHDSYEGAPDDGSAWTDPTESNRCRRGGSYADAAPFLRTADRNFEDAEGRHAHTGARCVRPAN